MASVAAGEASRQIGFDILKVAMFQLSGWRIAAFFDVAASNGSVSVFGANENFALGAFFISNGGRPSVRRTGWLRVS